MHRAMAAGGAQMHHAMAAGGAQMHHAMAAGMALAMSGGRRRSRGSALYT
jgi:hypothetical protein